MTTTDAARPEGTARRRTRSPDNTPRSRFRCTLAFVAAGSGSVGVTRLRECLLLRRVAPLCAWLLLRRCALRRAWDCSSAAAPRLPSCSGAAPLPHLLRRTSPSPLPHLLRRTSPSPLPHLSARPFVARRPVAISTISTQQAGRGCARCPTPRSRCACHSSR